MSNNNEIPKVGSAEYNEYMTEQAEKHTVSGAELNKATSNILPYGEEGKVSVRSGDRTLRLNTGDGIVHQGSYQSVNMSEDFNEIASSVGIMNTARTTGGNKNITGVDPNNVLVTIPNYGTTNLATAIELGLVKADANGNYTDVK